MRHKKGGGGERGTKKVVAAVAAAMNKKNLPFFHVSGCTSMRTEEERGRRMGKKKYKGSCSL